MTQPLEGASAATLRALSAALRSGQLAPPLTPLAVARVAPSASPEVAQELMRLTSEGMQPGHLALLIDAMAGVVEVRLASGVELVWTGPESAVSHSRDTAIVVAELFRTATRSVLVSTFAALQVETVFRPLAERMADLRGLDVRIFVHVARGDGDGRHESEILREYAARFGGAWPGPMRPTLYYDPRSLHVDLAQRATWHAKVIVVDDETSLVTSANFTEWAQQRNIEAGALIRSPEFARQLRHQFDGLVQSRAVLEIPGFRA